MARKPFDLMDSVPAALRGLILDFEWSRERLWALDLPAQAMAIEELRWLLALPWWSYSLRRFVTRPVNFALSDPRPALARGEG